MSKSGRWSLAWMFFVAFVQFVSELFFPNLYCDFHGWACNPVPGPQDAQRRVAIIVTRTNHSCGTAERSPGLPSLYKWSVHPCQQRHPHATSRQLQIGSRPNPASCCGYPGRLKWSGPIVSLWRKRGFANGNTNLSVCLLPPWGIWHPHYHH